MPERTGLEAEPQFVAAIAERCLPLGQDDPLDGLLEWIGDARVVLLGEATHGTHEFYELRAQLSQRLIEERGFAAVLVEADWPDAYRVCRYVRGQGADQTADEALSGFERFPGWMWRNSVVLEFIGWLRERNEGLALRQQAGFYGMDLYSLNRSMHEVVRYLDGVDPQAARRARERYACFDHYGDDPQAYGHAATALGAADCRDEVVAQLAELRTRAADYLRRDGLAAEEEQFAAEENARLASSAEEYYRSMFSGRIMSWNLRDQHMVETLERLLGHLERQGRGERIILWAHNSHLGDARATAASQAGEINVGQLVRERFGAAAFLLGFTTHSGYVTAATDWDAAPERMAVRPALPGSWEDVFHRTGVPRFALRLGTAAAERLTELRERRLERAIGVVYRPQTERQSHYFEARLAEQFDAVIHVDETEAVEPLERGRLWRDAEPAETYPTGL